MNNLNKQLHYLQYVLLYVLHLSESVYLLNQQQQQQNKYY